MIVKNEALHLGKSLKAITKYFDDIVVVDTGSTDDSKSIAKNLLTKFMTLNGYQIFPPQEIIHCNLPNMIGC
nr:hypothetical protein KXZ65_02760 [Pectobacterium sp. PL152]